MALLSIYSELRNISNSSIELKFRNPPCFIYLAIRPFYQMVLHGITDTIMQQAQSINKSYTAVLQVFGTRKQQKFPTSSTTARVQGIREFVWGFSRLGFSERTRMPCPSSETCMSLSPPSLTVTETVEAPASRLFSMSSFTADDGRWITSPAAMRFTTDSSSRRMRGGFAPPPARHGDGSSMSMTALGSWNSWGTAGIRLTPTKSTVHNLYSRYIVYSQTQNVLLRYRILGGPKRQTSFSVGPRATPPSG
jgi:hypothetical protein